jgi:ankyrin repeat protein
VCSVLVISGDITLGKTSIFLRPFQHNEWYKFQDEIVVRATLTEVFDNNFGYENPPVGAISSTPVFLLYLRESMIDNILWSPVQNMAHDGHDTIIGTLQESGRLTLQFAARKGHDKIAKLLLDNGADMEETDKYWNTTLLTAAFFGCETIVKLLLDNGADVKAVNNFGRSALYCAAYMGYAKVVEILLKKCIVANENSKATVGEVAQLEAAFRVAASCGHVTVMKQLLENGVDKNSADSHGRNALHLAARGGHLEIFNYLMDLGLDPAGKDKRGFATLHYAAASCSLEVLKLALEIPRFDSEWSNMWSALHWAARSGSFQMFQLLSEAGIKDTPVETLEPPGAWTALSIATFHQNIHLAPETSNESNDLVDRKQTDDMDRGATLDFTMTTRPEKAGCSAKGKKNGDYRCDGCFHVSLTKANIVQRIAQANLELGNIRPTVSLCRLSRFRLLFHV